MTDQGEAPPAKGPMPPHARLAGILSRDEQDRLLAWAIAHEQDFKPAKVYYRPKDGGGRVDLDRRTALKLRDLGPNGPMVEQRLLERLPEIMAAAGYRGPPPLSLEFELNAYGEGGHFRAHSDIVTGQDRATLGAQPGEDRLVSAVYYFHREPKGFSGGALRLFRFGADISQPDADDAVDFEPEQNTLVVFPSWAMHQVEEVRCPSGRFEDYRFALNCWFCRAIGA